MCYFLIARTDTLWCWKHRAVLQRLQSSLLIINTSLCPVPTQIHPPQPLQPPCRQPPQGHVCFVRGSHHSSGAPVLSAPQYLYRHYTRGRYKGITLKGKRLIDAQLLVWIRICVCTFVNALSDFCSFVGSLTQIISLFHRTVHINVYETVSYFHLTYCRYVCSVCNVHWGALVNAIWECNNPKIFNKTLDWINSTLEWMASSGGHFVIGRSVQGLIEKLT